MNEQQKKELQIFLVISFLLLAFGSYVLYGIHLGGKIGKTTITIQDINIYCYDGGCEHIFTSTHGKKYELRVGRYSDNKRAAKLIDSLKIGSTFNIKYQGEEQTYIFRKIYPTILKIEN